VPWFFRRSTAPLASRKVRYYSLLHAKPCAICAGLDGRLFDPNSDAWALNKPPHPRCCNPEGCRCFFVEEFGWRTGRSDDRRA
jgi:hypothetical protein